MKEFEKPSIDLWKILSESITSGDIVGDSWAMGDGEEGWED